VGFVSNPGRTLTICNGAHSAAIALLGQYLAANFMLSGDSHGGIAIIDPPLNQQLLTQPHA